MDQDTQELTRTLSPSRILKRDRLRSCVECGASFASANRDKTCCGRSCAKARSTRTRCDNARARNARICQRCGVGFTEGWSGTRKGVQKFCSKVCAGIAKRLYERKVDAKRAEYARARERKGLPPVWIACERTCAQCGATFTAKARESRLCSEPCRVMERSKLGRGRRRCAQCDVAFTPVYGKWQRLYCSNVCARRALAAATGDNRRRARHFGVAYEPVNPIRVFKRDGWRCQLCFCKTPSRLRGTCAPDAPELDHIQPMSAGGDHSYRNTQLACRACNSAKGAKPLGQLRLFG